MLNIACVLDAGQAPDVTCQTGQHLTVKNGPDVILTPQLEYSHSDYRVAARSNGSIQGSQRSVEELALAEDRLSVHSYQNSSRTSSIR